MASESVDALVAEFFGRLAASAESSRREHVQPPPPPGPVLRLVHVSSSDPEPGSAVPRPRLRLVDSERSTPEQGEH